MPCENRITQSIVSNCTTTPTGGAEIKAWIMNRKDVTFTFDPANSLLITGATMASGTQAFTIDGFKALHNAGQDMTAENTRPGRYAHYFNTQGWEISADARYNLDNAEDVVVIVERRNKGVDGDGAFAVLGAKNGLYKSTDTERTNDIDGARNIEWTSLDIALEPYSSYVFDAGGYQASKDALIALETAAA